MKNLMEEKQLDFSQPILSVRRSSSPVVAVKDRNRKPANVTKHPLYKADRPEANLGQVRVSGTVPFIWERSPGRPKNDEAAAAAISSEPNSPVVPKLPPGRRINVGSEGSSSPAPSCSPQIRNGFFANSEAKAEEKSTDEDDDEEEEEEEVRFVDAQDTLSRTESSFSNCSVAGVISGLDHGPDTRPNRTLSSDMRAREFMIGRFLPAAEAMASETTSQHSPRYPTKKQPVLKEQARQIKTFDQCSETRPLSNRGNILASYYGGNDPVDDDRSEPDASSLRLCGFLPRSCLPNHVPSSSVRTRGVQPFQPSRYDSKHSIDTFRARRCPTNNVGGSSPNKGWTHNNESVPQPVAPKGQGFLGIPERYRNLETVGSILCVKEDISSFSELLSAKDDDEMEEWESGSSTPVVEKTLYIDPASSKDDKHEKFRSFGSCYLSFSDDEDEEKHDHGNSAAVHPLSLPLPKCPSESWLKKALPTVPSSRTQLSKSPLGVVVFSKSSPDVWKTIVKASDGKNMRFQFSEGKLKPIPEA